MSNLQQSMLKAKLAKLPNLPSLNPDGSPANDEGRDQDEAQGEEEEEGGDGLGELGFVLPFVRHSTKEERGGR
jgi:hypothetical protein